MAVDLSQTLDLHRRILTDLSLREAAIAQKETGARKALEATLHNLAAEKQAIRECRELLAQTEMLYRSYGGSNDDCAHRNVRRPSDTPAAVPEQTSSPALAVVVEQPPLSATEVAPNAMSVSLDLEVSSPIEHLRRQIGPDFESDDRGGSWWAGILRNGSRNAEEEISWKKAQPPVEGAARSIWDHNSAN